MVVVVVVVVVGALVVVVLVVVRVLRVCPQDPFAFRVGLEGRSFFAALGAVRLGG